MRRHLLGIIAICFLIGGTGLLVFGSDEDTWMASIGVRVGFTLGAIWLAFPKAVEIAERYPPWLIASLAIGGLVIIARPKTAVFILPALAAIVALKFVGWLFKPLPNQPKRKGKPRS